MLAGRQRIVLVNQGLLGIAFFEATAFIVLLVLFFIFQRDHINRYFRVWVVGWLVFTLASLAEVTMLGRDLPQLWLAVVMGRVAALLLFSAAIVQFTSGTGKRGLPILPLAGLVLFGVYYFQRSVSPFYGNVQWGTALLASAVCLWTGMVLWRSRPLQGGHGVRLLGGIFLLSGLHGMDRPLWLQHPYFLLRVAFDHLLGVALGIGMVVVVLEGARARTVELNEKLRRLTLLTTASTQTLSVQEVLDRVLAHLVESLGATHGLVRLLEGEGDKTQLVVHASVGFQQEYLKKFGSMAAKSSWSQKVLHKDCEFLRLEDEQDPGVRQRMAESGIVNVITMALPGKDGPLGIIAIGSTRNEQFLADEISYLLNISNLLGLTLQNVRLFEQVATVQQQWAYTFDSIGDPILVHDRQGRILRCNLRLGHLLGRDSQLLVGRAVTDLLSRKNIAYKMCPYCEGVAGEGDDPDPWLQGYFLASNSTFTDPAGNLLGTVHVLKDITERKRAEEKYRTLVSSVQEGVFISTPQGRFLDFNIAMMRMTGYENREELLGADIPAAMYANPADRDRLKKLLQEHGSVADFEFEMRRKDGEIRTVIESSIAVRDAAGTVNAYQGFLLDITERKRAELEVRRRNRELLVLNSIGQTLTESMDLGDSLHRTLRQMAELFSLDACALYLFEEDSSKIRRVAAVGHRSEYARNFPAVAVKPELLHHIKAVHATFLSVQGLPLPAIFREAQRKEELLSAYVVVLWSKDRVIGGLTVGSRTPKEFSPADVNLLIAVGSQLASAIERTTLYEEARQAYDNLRRAQEQLLHSEKMAAVGQLISGVAHELNNPLTAILGYSQLLTSSGQMGPQGIEYSDKLYKQAQRTHRIVQNLLSFARQHKPERVLVQLNMILEETFALRDYDLRMNHIRVHLELAPDLPATSADPHQLQQVFLNMVNNAVDAMLEHCNEGDLWVRTSTNGDRLFIEFTDSGPGVKDASKVFDPFYTTKPVGKGTGLGLSICYGIITEHGGSIRVRNVPPRGASFTIEIPHQGAKPAKSSDPLQPMEQAREGRILLVDEDDSVLEAVRAILLEREHAVETAKSAADAMALLERKEFDLIVADLELAGAGGRNILHDWISARKPGLTKRCVWMRGAAPLGKSPDEAPLLGNQVLQKPFKAAELLAAVDAALAGFQAAPVRS
ncbi:MAG TPA: PAS domain S-box protein [Candidatus Acidoferrum sp.]|nr:PAS domain S-box protein [Candidatus Acidoferrum sp.]